MCGIYCIVGASAEDAPDWLRRRGPDLCLCRRSGAEAGAPSSFPPVSLFASVLQMRACMTTQPVAIDNGVHLAWNGEVYQYLKEGSVVDVWDYEQADTQLVADMVRPALLLTDKNPAAMLVEVLSSFFNAEFAFCITAKTTIYFGRDRFGRRSLLTTSEPSFHLASVAASKNDKWTEVPPGHLFCYDMATCQTTSIPFQTASVPLPCLSAFESVDNAAIQASLKLQELLLQAVRRRSQGPTSILFSGGLDSVVIAALTLMIHDSVTLVNVAFVEDDSNHHQESATPADTVAAIASYQDLQQLFPNATINFVQEQVTWKEILESEQHIQSLIRPKTTTMDLNISTALWFAARACDSRILLTGLGADEQMGGYGRHRKAWERGRLREELNKDMDRLWERNLGRDDRVLSDLAKEARFPFLDPLVVQFLANESLENICDLSLPPGEGDKRILRLVAKRLGLKAASCAVKRAIQFGSRIAHVSDKKRFGSRRKATGEANYNATGATTR